MRAQGDIAAWGAGVGVGAQAGSLGWFQRLRRWWAGFALRRRHSIAAGAYRSSHGRREQFRPPRMEAAIEHAAAQGGQFWPVILYNSTL